MIAEAGRSVSGSAQAGSAADAELLDDGLIALVVLAASIVEQLTAQAHHLQKATARVVVLLVRLEVLGQVIDAMRQDRDLHFRRASIVGLGGVRLDDSGLGSLILGTNLRHQLSFLIQDIDV